MSKLRRRIRNLGRSTNNGIGFAATRNAEPARQLLVVADVTSGDPAAIVAAGADALLVAPDQVAAAVAAAGDHPVGVRLDAATAEAVNAAVIAGADFFVFDDARTAATALLPAPESDRRAEPGRILRLEADPSEERLRSITALALDAMLVEGAGSAMTVREQLALRRTAELASAPLMATATAAPTSDALQVWRDAGTRLVLVPGDAETVRATAAAAAQVPAPRRTRDDREDRGSPLIPAIGVHHHHDDEDDEDAI